MRTRGSHNPSQLLEYYGQS